MRLSSSACGHTAPAQHREHVVIREAGSWNRLRGIVCAGIGGKHQRKSEGLDSGVVGGQKREDGEGEAGASGTGNDVRARAQQQKGVSNPSLLHNTDTTPGITPLQNNYEYP